jgi:pyruvate dehydrogenase E2 component (dihydrolipoamide acetyltransferase)
MLEFRMPSLGADMKKGTLVEWKVKPGDRVKRGDILAEVETEKGIIEIEVFAEGVVEKLLARPGDEVPVGGIMALIRTDEPLGREIQAAPFSLELAAVPPVEARGVSGFRENTGGPWETPEAESTPPAKPEHLAEPGREKRLKISPAARKRAMELGVDVTILQGTGPGKAITLADIEKALSAGKTPGEDASRIVPPLVEDSDFQLHMRQAIAAAMSRSNREIPHYYLETRIDMSHAMNWLREENLRRSVKDRLLPVVLLLKATALALAEIPALNGYWIEDRHEPREEVHIGFAIALRQGGLIAPAIHHVNLKTLDEIMAAMKDLIVRTRSGRLRSSEMSEATITLTNFGDLGVERSFGVIYPPQVALVSFGKMTDQPWVENGMIGVRPVINASLSGDHRATDGRTGAQFLNALHRYLQETEKL